MNNLKEFILYYDKHKGECNGAFCALAAIIAVVVLGFVFMPLGMLFLIGAVLTFALFSWFINYLWKKVVKWAEGS